MDERVTAIGRAVTGELLSQSPDVPKVVEHIRSETGLSASDSEKLLASIVERLNSAIFPPIGKMELLLIEGCNLACHYCFEGNMLRSSIRPNRRMTCDTIEKAIDLLIRYSGKEEDLQLTLFGGEPTLHVDGIRHAVEYAEECASRSDKKIMFNMTTNGVLLNDEMADYLARHDVRVLLSIDGIESAHDKHRVDRKGRGTFSRVMDGMKLLKKKQPWIGIKMTIMPDIADTLYDSARELHRLGVNQFLIGHATGVSWSRQDMETYAEQTRLLYEWYKGRRGGELKITGFDEERRPGGYFGCSAGRSRVSVAPNGDITGCSRISTLDGKETRGRLGNVHVGLFEIQGRLEMTGCRSLIRNCTELGIAEKYRGGCFATNYEANGDLFAPSLLEYEFSALLEDITSRKRGGKERD